MSSQNNIGFQQGANTSYNGYTGSYNKPTTTVVSTPRRKELQLSDKGKVILTKEVQDQIAYLHSKVGAKEWCGVLFYKKTAGDITDPASLELTVDHIFLMDIGRETYTDADFDSDDVVDMWESVGDDYTYKRGLIHTHHNMTTFFSGTDMAELHDNTHLHNYYLSLIVNFSGVYTAKVAFIATKKVKTESSFSFKNVDDEEIVTTSDSESTEELLAMIDMEIVKEKEELVLPATFLSRYDKIEQEAKATSSPYTPKTQWAHQYGNNYNPKGASSSSNKRSSYDWDNDDDWYGVSTEGDLPSHAKEKFIIDEDGNARKGDKVYKPRDLFEEGISEKIIDWFNHGFNVFDNCEWEGSKVETIADYINWFEDYFDGDADDVDRNYWLNTMQHKMLKSFKGYSPALISRIAADLIWNTLSEEPTTFGLDIYNLFKDYAEYERENGKTRLVDKHGNVIRPMTEEDITDGFDNSNEVDTAPNTEEDPDYPAGYTDDEEIIGGPDGEVIINSVKVGGHGKRNNSRKENKKDKKQ